jgi:hypothetical protein
MQALLLSILTGASCRVLCMFQRIRLSKHQVSVQFVTRCSRVLQRTGGLFSISGGGNSLASFTLSSLY